MEFEGLTQRQAESLFTLVEICGIEIPEARRLLQICDFNVEQATQLHFNPQAQKPSQIPQQVIPQYYENQGMQFEDQFDDDQDPGFARYRNFRFSGETFENKYPLNKSVASGIINWLKRQVSLGQQFTQRLDAVFPGQNKVKFLKGNFIEAMHLVKKQKFPLIVFLHNFDSKFNTLTKNLISNSNVTQFFNETFRIIGFDTSTYKLDGILQQTIDQKTIPCMAVYKIDDCQNIQIMDTVQLSPQIDLKQLKKRLNLSKNRYIKDQIREDEYSKRFNNQINGIYDNNPMTFERKLQLAQERKIKKIQQSQLKESNRLLQIKKKQQQIALNKEKQKQNDRVKLIQQRKIDRQNLKIYESGIRIRLRFPNSNQAQVVVPLDAKVQYLFDYVNSTQDIGLEEDVYRKFDIIRPYDKLTLKDVKDKTLLQVFGETDSESLVVTEL